MVLHRIHLQNANKPLFSVESEQCQALGMSQGCAAWPCVPLKNGTSWYHPVQAETGVCCFLLKFNTDYRCPNHIQLLHTVRSEGGGMVYCLDTGQELKERPGYRDLLHIQYLSPLAPQIHHTRTDLVRESVLYPI